MPSFTGAENSIEFSLEEEGIWPQKGTRGSKKMANHDCSYFVPFCGHSSFKFSG
jgi:hypothetical protein